ncbi:MAG: PQQ-dependent sugar dehydrogenase [Chitinophagales bacterium]|nr:PQQ-dependent sugar dehydrogenase [Chitinophagales bacterium]
MTSKKWFIPFLCLICCLTTKAQNTITLDSTIVQVTVLATNQDVPWEILWGPDNWLWMTERGGTISRMNPDTGEKIPLFTIPDCYEQQESGLLGMVLHPDFVNQPYVYLVYNYLQGFQIKERLVRYTYNGTTFTDPFIMLNSISGNSTHIGSRLLILPDSTLLMTTGDAQDQPASQDLNELTGKVLRFNLDGTIPADNPFGVDNPVYSYGHRNAQGLVLAPNGLLYSSEHGPTNDDELNVIVKGANYGWPTVQGFCDTPLEAAFCSANTVTEPLLSWTPTLAVAGIDYFNHPSIPEWQNSILMATLKAKRFYQFSLATDGTIAESNVFLENVFGRLRDVCVAPDGRIFVSSSNRDAYGTPSANDDRIIVLRNPNYNLPIANFTYTIDSCAMVQFTSLSENAQYYQWDFGDGYTSTTANPIHIYLNAGEYNVQMVAANSYASDTISFPINITCNVGVSNPVGLPIQIVPNPMTDAMQLSYPMSWGGAILCIYNMEGKVVSQATLDSSGGFVWQCQHAPAGAYYLQIKTLQGVYVHQKMIVQ